MYHQIRQPNNCIIPRAAFRQGVEAEPLRKVALAVIDMESSAHFPGKIIPYCIRYDRGNLEKGLRRLANLVETARKFEMPTIFFKMNNQVVPALTDAAGPGAIVLWKRKPSAFSNPIFEITLRELGISVLLLGGYHEGVCVLDTAKEAVDKGFRVATSPYVLFRDRNPENKGELFRLSGPNVALYKGAYDPLQIMRFAASLALLPAP